MNRIMKEQLEKNSMKKITSQKYDMLRDQEKEIAREEEMQKIKKKEEIKRMHEILEY